MKVGSDGTVGASADLGDLSAVSSDRLPALATSDGDLWVADNKGLIRLAGDTMNTTRFDFPSVPGAGAADASLPPPHRGARWPVAITAGVKNDFYIVGANATALLRFDLAARTFSTVDLPTSTEDAGGVAVLADGTIGVTLHSHKSGNSNAISIYSAGSWNTVAVPAAAYIVTAGANFLTGGLAAYTVSEDGKSVVELSQATILPEPPPVGRSAYHTWSDCAPPAPRCAGPCTSARTWRFAVVDDEATDGQRCGRGSPNVTTVRARKYFTIRSATASYVGTVTPSGAPPASAMRRFTTSIDSMMRRKAS